MTIHWTNFPERVEQFGDLFNIFETFEHDVRADLIHSGSCEKETDESAYTVEFVGGARIIPRPDRIPGWEQLATYIERETGAEVSLVCLRTIRGFLSEIGDMPLAAVNEMTVVEVGQVLDEVRRQPAVREGAADPLLDEYRFLKVKQIAKLFAFSSSEVSKLANAGAFVTNGRTGHDRRIDVLSVVKRELHRLNREDDAGADTPG